MTTLASRPQVALVVRPAINDTNDMIDLKVIGPSAVYAAGSISTDYPLADPPPLAGRDPVPLLERRPAKSMVIAAGSTLDQIGASRLQTRLHRDFISELSSWYLSHMSIPMTTVTAASILYSESLVCLRTVTCPPATALVIALRT